MRGSEIDAVINQLGARSSSIVHARDLRAAGISRDAIATRIRGRSLRLVLPRTYACGPAALTLPRETMCMAGALAGGHGAVVTGETAAELSIGWDRGGTSIHVAARRPIHWEVPRPYTFLRSHVVGPVQRSTGGVPLAPFVDMCWHMATSATPWQLAFVIRRGVFDRAVDLPALDASVAAHPYRAGRPALARAVELIRGDSAGTRGIAEDLILATMLELGVPTPLVNVRGCLGMDRDEPDFAWVGRRVNLEVDGRQHDEPTQAADDRRRDAGYAERQVVVVRVRAREVMRRSRRIQVAKAIGRLLEGGSVDLRPTTRRLR